MLLSVQILRQLLIDFNSIFSNNYAHGSHGPDYVDYGAYTGGYGAFGWYSDHPVGGGYHR